MDGRNVSSLRMSPSHSLRLQAVPRLGQRLLSRSNGPRSCLILQGASGRFCQHDQRRQPRQSGPQRDPRSVSAPPYLLRRSRRPVPRKPPANCPRLLLHPSPPLCCCFLVVARARTNNLPNSRAPPLLGKPQHLKACPPATLLDWWLALSFSSLAACASRLPCLRAATRRRKQSLSSSGQRAALASETSTAKARANETLASNPTWRGKAPTLP